MSNALQASRGRVRVYYANWLPAGIWKRRDACRTVERGLGEWVPIARANRPSLWTDAAAGGPEYREPVLLLCRLPPSAEVARRMWRREQCRARRRDAVAAALPARCLAADASVPRFARTGQPVEGDAWRTVVRLARAEMAHRGRPDDQTGAGQRVHAGVANAPRADAYRASTSGHQPVPTL